MDTGFTGDGLASLVLGRNETKQRDGDHDITSMYAVFLLALHARLRYLPVAAAINDMELNRSLVENGPTNLSSPVSAS